MDLLFKFMFPYAGFEFKNIDWFSRKNVKKTTKSVFIDIDYFVSLDLNIAKGPESFNAKP